MRPQLSVLCGVVVDVQRFSDLYNAPGKDLPIVQVKVNARAYVEGKAAEGKITWTTISVGGFFDWGLVNKFLGFGMWTLNIKRGAEQMCHRPEEQNGHPLRRGELPLPHHDTRFDQPIRDWCIEPPSRDREQACPRS